MNNLFNSLNGGNRNPMNIIQQFLQFKNSFNGNAQEEVQKIISSGKYSQGQINQIQNMARQLNSLLSMLDK